MPQRKRQSSFARFGRCVNGLLEGETAAVRSRSRKRGRMLITLNLRRSAAQGIQAILVACA